MRQIRLLGGCSSFIYLQVSTFLPVLDPDRLGGTKTESLYIVTGTETPNVRVNVLS